MNTHNTYRLALLIATLVLASVACNLPLPGGETPTATPITATDAPPTDAPAPTETTPATGHVEGQMCFPSEYIPAMTAYFENANTAELFELPIAENQLSFGIDLPPGQYIAYAWLPDMSFGGSYSQAVPCGLDVSCTDHSPLVFDVVADMTTAKVNICDWYGQPGDVPVPNN